MSAPSNIGPQADIPAERAVLSSILMDNGVLDEVADLIAPADFYSVQNAEVFSAMLALSAKQERIDLITLRSELASAGKLKRAGGEESLASLHEEIPNVEAAEAYARRVRGLATVRTMVEKCAAVVARGRQPVSDVDAFLDEAEASIHGVSTSRRSDRRMRSMKELVIEVVEDVLKRPEVGAVRGAPTGIRLLDLMLAGLRSGQLIIAAGRPGMGKTAFALAVMACAARAGEGAAVLGWTGEMESPEWAERSLVAESGIDGNVVRAGGHGQGVGLRPSEMSKLTNAAGTLANLPIYIDDTPSISLWQLRSKARRLRAQKGLALVVVDYLQLMRSGERMEDREKEIAAISRGLKSLAKELECPVLALSQLNRKVEERSDKRPGIADIRESGQIEQDADVILFLYREGFYDKAAPQNVAEVIVAKQRAGRMGTVQAYFEPTFMRWGNLTPDGVPENLPEYDPRDEPNDFSDDDGVYR